MEENRAAEMPDDVTKVDSVDNDRVVSPDVSQPNDFPNRIDDDGDASVNEGKINSGGSTLGARDGRSREDVPYGNIIVDVEKIEYDDAASTKENLTGNIRFGLSNEAEARVSADVGTDASNVRMMDKKVAREVARAETTKFLCRANRRIPIGRTIGKVISPRKQRMWDGFPGILAGACRMCDWIPKMCSCIESRANVSANSRYQRLASAPTLFQYSTTVQSSQDAAEEPVDSERQAELTFYFGDNTCKKLTVEKNLRIVDLCELLKVNKNSIGNAWSIVETWSELGIERTLEDHEDILATHREMEKFASHHDRKFYLLEDFTKYEVFINPKQFFPRDMVAFPNDEDRGPIGDPEDALRRYLTRDNTECPEVCSLIWIRHEGSTSWKKLHMLLQGRKLYTTRKGSFMNSKFPKTRLLPLSTRSNCINQRSLSPDPIPSTSNTTSITRLSGRFHHPNTGSTPKRMQDNEQPSTLAHLSDYYIYKISNAKKYFNAPYEWAVCLRPSSDAEAEDTEAGVRGIKVIAFTSEKARNCWLTAMRLAKYGKQLRENYRAFKNKQCDQNSGGSTKEQYTSYNVTNESLRSRVAMDFTGSVGRIVEDPKEAKDIAESEGITWRRRWRPFSRQRPGASTLVGLHGLDRGIHVLQPWFHSNLNREVAAAIIKEHGTVDGVFLVRESKSNPGSYVLTYKYNDKVFHCQIQAMFDERGDCWLFTLDRGVTKFYDLLQMIEFHQLNSGSLPTKLTHYVKSGVTPHQRSEDGGASPSPPSSSNRSSLSPKSPKSSSGM